MTRRAKPHPVGKYTGALASPLAPKPMPGRGIGCITLDPERQKEIDRERNAEWLRRFELLFEWHKVEFGDWPGLAAALAITHVPGFQIGAPRRGRGRPTRLQQLAGTSLPLYVERLSRLADAMRDAPRRKPGRPRKFSPESDAQFVKLADAWRAKQVAAGVKRVSDAAFVRYLCKQHAESNGLSLRSVSRDHFNAFTNQLSRARKSLSKSR